MNCQNCLEIAKEIYPNKLELECTFLGNNAEFLDLDILLENGAFATTVFNKVDSFPFKVNRFGYPGSCVPPHSHLSVLYSQLIRYCRICSKKSDFIAKTRELFLIYAKRHFDVASLYSTFFRFAAYNSTLLIKFMFPSKKAISLLSMEVFHNFPV